nr:hypothetical protein [Tanacetum cinerariifolium]
MTTSVENNSVFKSFFEKQKLIGSNFIDWYKQLRLVLLTEDKENYLEHPIPEAPIAPPRQQVPPAAAAAHAAWVKGQKEVVVLMLLTIDLDIQQNLAHLVSLILVSLNKDYDSFVQNYNMHSMGKTVNELHAMLKMHEDTLPKKDNNPALHAIRAGRVQKNQKNKPHKAAKEGHGKGKGKMGYAPNNASFAPKPMTPPPPKKDDPSKDAICHQCGEDWRRNCPVYLVELMKKKKLSQGASTLGIFTIELYSFPSKFWIYDTDYGTHICITTQGLRKSKKLKPGALSLYVGDGHRAAVKAIETYHLELPSGLVIVLNNCHYAPSITRGVISVARLFDDGFSNSFDENNVISVSKNNLVYFMVVSRDGIFEIDMSCSNTNDSFMYAISNKRAKINLDSSLLWHCRLRHISKKHIKKLQHDGLLNSIDIESLEKIVSRQGANYFVTFTDDFSRYGYVCLLKHKDELFEIIKAFQKEVENQLGKTIKSLRSDLGGEYMSQEFLDHLKEHEIIAHHTPPYTPQHNEIDEPQSDINPIRKSSRTRRAPYRMCLYIDAEEHELRDLNEPANYKAALLDLESKKWLDAMNVEMQSMKDNDVWVLVELPSNARTIGSKWLFKRKTDMDGAIYVFKALLVAKGFTQTYGVDYEETFSPVAYIRAIRILIAIAT